MKWHKKPIDEWWDNESHETKAKFLSKFTNNFSSKSIESDFRDLDPNVKKQLKKWRTITNPKWI